MARKKAEEKAWREYLAETTGLIGPHYEEVESWAWSRLTKKLYTITKRESEKKVAA